MDAKDFMGGTYLSKDAVSEPVIVTIASADRKQFEGDARPKLILSFREFEKAFVCNKTNVSLAASAFQTTSVDSWIGKRLVLYNDPTVSFSGRMLGGLRLRALTENEQQKVASASNDAAPGGAVGGDSSDLL